MEMNLYDQLLGLQVIENAFVEWRPYRDDLTDYIIKNMKKDESLAIFGAGRCNDIDLKRLSNHFSAIVLLDKDEEAMKEGLRQYGLENASIITTQVIDFVGIDSKDYRDYADQLVTEVRKKGMQTDSHVLAETALALLETLYEKALLNQVDIKENSYENAIVIGVHSQLISMLEWIWSIILQTIQQDEESVRQAIAKMNDALVEKFNTLVLKATKHMVIMGYEKNRLNRIGSIQGAYQAMEDMRNRALKGEIERADLIELTWPFHASQGITYKVVAEKFYIREA